MMRPDVILTWPKSCDYPLWRQFIRDNRPRFNEIVIAFMETNQGQDYRQFVRDAMFVDHVLFLESPGYDAGWQDWRDVAVNAALMHSLHSEWIWFTEQDFFPLGAFFDTVDALSKEHEYIGIIEGQNRLHPACLFVKRSLLAQTRRNFGIVPNKLDHFGLIQEDFASLEANGALLSPDLYNHMAGLSHNMSLVERHEAPNHKLAEFRKYIEACLKVTVPLHQSYKKLYEGYLAR